MHVYKVMVFALIAFMLSEASPAYAEMIPAVDIHAVGDGTTRYDYTVRNDSAEGLYVDFFKITVASSAILESISAPDGWYIDYSPGAQNISWIVDPDYDQVIAPGGMASFGFISNGPPLMAEYTIEGISDDFQTARNFTGPVLSPGPVVPEPGGLALGMMGMCIVLAGWLRCR